jgi:hypothetical protein
MQQQLLLSLPSTMLQELQSELCVRGRTGDMRGAGSVAFKATIFDDNLDEDVSTELIRAPKEHN